MITLTLLTLMSSGLLAENVMSEYSHLRSLLNSPKEAGPTREMLVAVESSARQLLSRPRPHDVSDAAWASIQATAYKGLGWHSMRSGNFTTAQQHFSRALALNPNDGRLSYWTAYSIKEEGKPGWQSASIYHYVRAAVYDGLEALSNGQRAGVLDFAQRAYTHHHGHDPDGFDELKNLCRRLPIPPPTFHIPSKAERD
ncbi:MAG: tetratricopeptide repeat protein [Bryobacterales bacterium]|nr:tetratricopeptide repeat protein [Bryobacterales bacterium]